MMNIGRQVKVWQVEDAGAEQLFVPDEVPEHDEADDGASIAATAEPVPDLRVAFVPVFPNQHRRVR